MRHTMGRKYTIPWAFCRKLRDWSLNCHEIPVPAFLLFSIMVRSRQAGCILRFCRLPISWSSRLFAGRQFQYAQYGNKALTRSVLPALPARWQSIYDRSERQSCPGAQGKVWSGSLGRQGVEHEVGIPDNLRKNRTRCSCWG